MSEWVDGQLADSIAALDAGVSVNAEDRPHGAGEIGVLKTSAVSGGRFFPNQNKTVVERERRLVAEPVHGDSILVSRMNTPALVGESCYVPEAHPTLFLPDRIWQLKPRDRGEIDMRWLSFLLQSAAYRRYVEVHATGTSGSMKNLPKSKLLSLPVRYPSLSEQVEVAQILDTLEAAVHETEALIAKLKAVKQGLLHDLLTRGIDANGELRPLQPEAPHLYKQSPLGWIPKEWDVVRLDDIAQRGSGHTPSKSVSSYWNGGIKWVSLADSHHLDNIYIRETDKEVSELGIANSSAVVHPAGTVILSRDAGVGKSALLACPMAVSQHFITWRCGGRLHNLFLYFHLQQQKPRFEAIALGSTIKTIGLPFFKGYELAIPSRPEQELVASTLMRAEAGLAAHDSDAAKLRELKSGLMDDLLTGRVRVTPLLASESEGSA